MEYIIGIIGAIVLWLLWSYFKCKTDLNNAINLLVSRKENTVMIGCDIRSAVRYFTNKNLEIRITGGRYNLTFENLFIQIYEHKGFTFLHAEDLIKTEKDT
ncbi:hypothetical protein GJV85_06505 [Sulfurimonas aquatica]|uniref:Uncharacterized protein n=1 Tax=Sulfurimonas aquatica TaxID=2672570 RepID=A0A975B087_9BACT|nr:hypothetical protein [Sulfurimonas aquatica]QSZ41773.1 hypothetical protein GJV85_06505 [Sulfurimonas aquatica]